MLCPVCVTKGLDEEQCLAPCRRYCKQSDHFKPTDYDTACAHVPSFSIDVVQTFLSPTVRCQIRGTNILNNCLQLICLAEICSTLIGYRSMTLPLHDSVLTSVLPSHHLTPNTVRATDNITSRVVATVSAGKLGQIQQIPRTVISS